jgi:hypothetical protein
MNVWLPYTNCGIATYLNRAIGMAGLSPARLRPCRPLPQTPVVFCMLAIAHSGLLPSVHWTPSAFSQTSGIIPMTTTIHFSGLNTQPASLIHPASDSPLGAGPRTSLLIWWLTFNQVGLESLLILTHWVTLSNFIPPSGNPNDLSLSRHDHWLVMCLHLILQESLNKR